MNVLRSIVILAACLPQLVHASAPAKPLNKVVAVVNDDVITSGDLAHQIDIVKKQMQSSGGPMPDEATLRQQVLTHMIDVELQLQIAKRGGLKITDKQLNENIEKILAKNHLSLTALKENLTQQGVTFEEFRENLRNDMTLSSLQQEIVGRDVIITDDQVQAFMKNNQQQLNVSQQYHLEDILVPLSDSPSKREIQQATQKADSIYQALQHKATPEKFADLNNDLGWHPLKELPEVFAKTAMAMKIGDISKPIQTPNGFHILKLVETRGNAMQAEQVRALLYRQRFAEAADAYVQQLRAKSYVQTFTA